MRQLLKSNNGIAVVMIVFIISAVFLLCVALLNYSDSLTRNVTLSSETEDALQIAEAGYNRYMYYLNDDSEFFRNPDGISINGAFGQEGFVPKTINNDLPEVYEETTYRMGDKVIGYYQIRVIQPSLNEDLTVISTGWTADNPNLKVTVKVKLHKKSFTEYVDFTDSSVNNGEKVYWTTGNVADGPVFCNGNIYVSGYPVFNDNVYTAGKLNEEKGKADIKGELYEGKDGIRKAEFPASNPEIKNWAKNGGIYLEGRTCIRLRNDQLEIRNIKKNNDEPYTVALPKNGVLYVEGMVFIAGELDGRLTVYATDIIYVTGKDPTNYNPKNAEKIGTFTYKSKNYNVGIIYADPNIPADKNAIGSNYSDDMLGLISAKDIIIPTRTWPASNTHGYKQYGYDDVIVENLIIFGALMTTGGQFRVEEYDKAPVSGTLSVWGSKIQNHPRGAVGKVSGNISKSGYSKQDKYDYRLKTITPPHFVTPADSGWEVTSWEVISNP